jgi:hypothetical protein
VNDDPLAPTRATLTASTLALVTAGGTLVCCVLPAVMVALGAGAALAGLVTAVPQLVWLSEQKALVFGVAGGMLLIAGIVLYYAQRAPCPTDSALGRACMRLRRASLWIYVVAVVMTATGAFFAFALPRLSA